MTKNERKSLPVGLQIVLEVIEKTRGEGKSKGQAFKEISQKRKIEYGTVLDKCYRRLEINAETWDKMTGSPKLHEFRKLLVKRFPAHEDIINKIINSVLKVQEDVKNDPGQEIVD
jgi:hypothetical protein